MSVKVAFQSTGETARQQTVLMIPKPAVRQDQGRDVVWVVKNGSVERRAVTIAVAGADEVTIAAGLNGGERVVTEGFDKLTDGAKVTETQ